LDPRVDDLAHVGPPRIRDDAAVAERARAPLHPPLIPADDPAVRDLGGGPPIETRFVAPALPPAALPSDLRAPGCHLRRALRVVERGTPVAVAHHEVARLAARAVPRMQRGAEGRAVVAGGRLDEDVAKIGALADLAVGHAVHRAAAGEAQRARARRSLN